MAQAKPPLSTRVLWQLIRGIDACLRRRIGIVEFDRGNDALLRIAVGHADREMQLSDGTRLHAGDRVLELHLWNEHLLTLPPKGRTLHWAAVIRRRAALSLRRLAAHVLAEPELGEVKALRIKPAFASRNLARNLSRIVAGYGFESVADHRRPTPGHSVYRWLDSLWLWLLTWTFNPLSLRGRRFQRTRQEYWISRARFIGLYGPPRVATLQQAPTRLQSTGAQPRSG